MTTMWEKLSNRSDGERKKEFLTGFWRHMINKGSAVVSHDGTKESAWEVVKTLLDTEKMLVRSSKFQWVISCVSRI